MLTKLICVLVVLGVIYLEGSNAIKCNLCLGSDKSDCANANKVGMIEQECLTIKIPHRRPHRHHHRRHHHDEDIDVTTSVNDIITNSLETTSRPESAEDFQRQEQKNNTSSTNKPPFEMVLEPSCIYLKLKASNVTSPLVTRGCGYMPPKKDICTIYKKWNKNVVECKSCKTDECN